MLSQINHSLPMSTGDVDFDDVDVIDFQLGYQDEDRRTYFVSKWEDGVNFGDYMTDLSNRKMFAERDKLVERFDQIYDTLGDKFIDKNYYNMLYSPKTDKLIVFDIHSE